MYKLYIILYPFADTSQYKYRSIFIECQER